MSSSRVVWLGLCLLFAALGGCKHSPYTFVPVSGRITLQGKPLENVNVSFQPIAVDKNSPRVGPGSFAKTDADGRFTLRVTEPDGPGAVIGKHAVRLARTIERQGPASDNSAPTDTLIPERFRNGTVTFEVPAGGTTEANFELAAK